MPQLKDICSALFAVQPETTTQPQGGSMLVAEPFLQEDCFSHSVISLIDYEPTGGAMGVVLNHRSPSMLSDLVDDYRIAVDAPVYIGGPLATDRLFFLHNIGADIIPNSRPYAPGLYVGGDFEAMLEFINSGYPTDGCVRFFVGYSGWEKGQLEQEISDGTWALSEAPQDTDLLLKGSDEQLWHRMVRGLGETYRSWRLVPRMTCVN